MRNSGLIATLLAGAAGGALVWHAGRAYQGEPGWGVVLVWVIALGFVAGLVELAVRDRRADAFSRLVPTLPARLNDRTALDALLASLPPRPRAVFDAYLGGRRPAEAPTLTGYLVSLLIMVGLLGTFLGFVDTLSGARMVLAKSADLQAIRDGLAAPLGGLTRSFGTSLAGVAASAALGLAAAVVRRAEARAAAGINTYATGPLAPFTPAGRELAALEQVSRQGEALPQAAVTLAQAVERLESLAQRLVEVQREGAQQVAGELSAAVQRSAQAMEAAASQVATAIGGAVEGAASRAGAQLTAAAEARFEAWGARFDAASQAHDQALETRVAKLTDTFERQMGRAAEAEAARARTSAEAVETASRVATERFEQALARLAAVEEQRAREAAARAESASATASERAERLDARLAALVEAVERGWAGLDRAASERGAAVLAALENGLDRVERGASERGAAALAVLEQGLATQETRASDRGAAALAALENGLERVERGASERSAATLATLETGLERVERGVSERSAATLATLETGLERVERGASERSAATLAALERGLAAHEANAAERAGALARGVEAFRDLVAHARADLSDGASTLRDALTRLGEGTSTLEATLAERMGAHVTALDAALAREADRFIAAQAARAEEAATVLQRVDAELAKHLTTLGEGLAAPLTAVARTAEEAPRAASQLVEAAAARWQASDAREEARSQALDALFERLATLADRLEHATTTQSRLWSEALAHSRESAEAAEARAEARLAVLGQQVATSITHQAERLAAFETALQAARDAGGASLAATLSDHARQLGTGLDTTGAMVREAAELVRAGGAELSAVAEMFADAVDRYRESSETWRQMLGGLEDALSRGGAGAGEAGALLGSYLDQTREVFGDALRFQRELFTELRALRGTPA